MSASTDLADAIVELLNSTEFSSPFQAVRRAAPLTITELEELKDLQVSVFTGTKKAERAVRGGVSRSPFEKTYKPIIAVQKYLDAPDAETELTQVDVLEGLVEEIETALEDEDLADLSFVGFDEEADRDPYNVEALQTLKAFVTAITLEYTSG